MTWRLWEDTDLEKQFNPRVALGQDAQKYLDEWFLSSKKRKDDLKGVFNCSYGSDPLMTFDRTFGDSDKPIIFNFHGGYWRALDKCYMYHHMADLQESGFSTININYPLCPNVSLTEIIETLDSAVKTIIKQTELDEANRKIVLMGHSAGALIILHLSKNEHFINKLLGVVALSGIFEPEVVRHISVNNDVKITLQEEQRWNCLKELPSKIPSYYFAVGGSEPTGWINQSVIMAMKLCKKNYSVELHVCQNANHFSVVDKMCDQKDEDGKLMLKWLLDLI